MKIFIVSKLKKERSPYKIIEDKYIKQLNRMNTSIINVIREIPPQTLRISSECTSCNIVLDPEGLSYSTQGLYGLYNSIEGNYKNLFFYIGDDAGHFPKNMPSPYIRLSLSKMVFNHFLIRVMMLEQLYRLQCILTNHPYHK